MKKTIQTFWKTITLTIVATACSVSFANAQEGSGPQVSDLLFVDVQQVLVGSSAMLDIRRQVSDQITAIRSDAQQEEANLIEEEKKLKAKADSISEEELQTEYRQLDEKLTRVRAELSQRLQAVQNGAFEAQREVENHLAEIFNSLRLERGADLLVNPQGILSADIGYTIPSEQNITDDVVTALDERLPAVVVMPRTIPPAPASPLSTIPDGTETDASEGQ
ncbi:MAG: OmpH family outer membrane protein [Hyphomicrobiales bacterium]|nr:OmpH family outer membrane protein [Hyphomicrobiales bacterium]MCY4038691.1 OmpH family outer membrane protein [Hyphomicrobiales bacterium]